MDVCASEFCCKVLHGTADANVRFEDLRSLLGALGFAERTRGRSSHLF